jgi:hypothetical protein
MQSPLPLYLSFSEVFMLFLSIVSNVIIFTAVLFHYFVAIIILKLRTEDIFEQVRGEISLS